MKAFYNSDNLNRMKDSVSLVTFCSPSFWRRLRFIQVQQSYAFWPASPRLPEWWTSVVSRPPDGPGAALYLLGTLLLLGEVFEACGSGLVWKTWTESIILRYFSWLSNKNFFLVQWACKADLVLHHSGHFQTRALLLTNLFSLWPVGGCAPFRLSCSNHSRLHFIFTHTDHEVHSRNAVFTLQSKLTVVCICMCLFGNHSSTCQNSAIKWA